jgi:predicted CXXCH cytochrome family protein
MAKWPRRLLYGLLFCAPVGLAGERHWRSDDSLFLPGRTSNGHHQIESQCSTCHAAPFEGAADQACLACHGDSLRARNDSHAPVKFDDPARADQLALVDARSCVACHREHRAEARLRGRVSVPATFCVGCHAGIRQELPNHAGFDDAGCASASCHNYHDNRALRRDLLRKQRGSDDLRVDARLPTPPAPVLTAGALRVPLPARAAAPDGRTPPRPDVPESARQDPGPGGLEPEAWQGRIAPATREWAASAHARGQVNCTGCHQGAGRRSGGWIWTVDDAVCANCHRDERLGFRAGKHGMRLVVGLSPMSPGLARAPMRPEASTRALGCTSCHGAHRFDRAWAAVSACEGCHDDGHTRAYRASPHFVAWRQEQREEAAPGTGVSCATCHMPRQPIERDGVPALRVEHNQNGNLRPSDRMWREVCIHCHGARFSLASLADAALVQSNFRGRPAPAPNGMDLIERETP